MTELNFKLVRDHIADHLRHEILTGKLQEGVAIREIPLATRFKVSRGPIRDAILQLTKEGLLEAQPNRGARVGRVWDEDLRPMMMRMRLEIELFALKELLELGPNLDLAPFRRNLQSLQIACEETDLPSVVKFDMEFHRLILRTCKHPGVESVWLTIMGGMRLPYSRHKQLIEIHAEHSRIVDAVEKGDPDNAAEALKANIH